MDEPPSLVSCSPDDIAAFLIMTDSQTMQICPLTAPGRGGVAALGVRGELAPMNSCYRAANGKQIEEQALDRICFGHWGAAPGEEVVLVRTGSAEAEIYCHGGIAAVGQILQELHELGARVLLAEEWVLQAEGQERGECLLALARASTQRTAHHLLRQATLFPAAMQQLPQLAAVDRRERLERMLAWSEFGQHLSTPWKVVLCGRPNVGKSSLINALVGYTRTVVFDEPGTTRDVVCVETAFDGWPVDLSDTAGLRETRNDLEAAGIGKARQEISAADLIVVVVDAQCGQGPEEDELLREFPQAVLVWNKTDVAAVPSATKHAAADGLSVSAKTGAGLAELIDLIQRRLVPEEPAADVAFPVTRGQCRRLREHLARL